MTANDQLVFIQRKRKTGEHEFHTVQPGETVNDIAQSEALRLESLLEYNNITANMQPAAGGDLISPFKIDLLHQSWPLKIQ